MASIVEKEGKPVTRNEQLKDAIPTLAGHIAATLADPTAACFSADDEQFLKFHGIYQQDDRDLRKTGKKHLVMIRGRIPGGVLSRGQWLVFDDLATRYGNDTLRLTTRQSVQFHGVVKSGLGPLMKAIHTALLDTLAACGDVNRNVMASPAPAESGAREWVIADARRLSTALLPRTQAYHAIWVDGVQLNLEDPGVKGFEDPLYGRHYLPRKFKAAVVLPPVNDLDVFSNDLGFIAIVEGGQLAGYNVSVGGGLGRSHGNDATYPRLADVLGFLTPDQLVAVGRAVVEVHRDFGDRTDRKHARLKYIVQERGVDWTRAEIERRAGVKLAPARPYFFTTTADTYGWSRQHDGRWYLTLYVESGRVRDGARGAVKTALREAAERFDFEFRISANQNLILANVAESDRAALDALLRGHRAPVDGPPTALHGGALACPALPTCGLALAESERYLPTVLGQLDAVLTDLGLAAEPITLRVTGCPNGCARPYLAEIGLVGKAPGRYQIWLGADAAGARLNRLWQDNVKEADLIGQLRGALSQFAQQRGAGERFGDFADRVLLPAATAN